MTRTFRRLPLRVALGTVALASVVFVAVVGTVDALVGQSLSSDLDHRIATVLAATRRDGVPPRRFASRPAGQAQDRLFRAPLLVWFVGPDGTIRSGPSSPTLPPADRHAVGPATRTLSGTEFRLQGAARPDGWVVVGGSTAVISQVRSTLIVAEAAVGPVLLAAVFLAALAIGKRVARPIEEARRRQIDFTADASHELRTPLSVIEAEVALALAARRDAESHAATLERVGAEGRRLRRLVDDLLWLARFDAEPAPPAAEMVDLGLLVEAVARRFGPIAAARGQRLRVENDAVDAAVTAPPEWLDRLAGVLIDNACRYSPDGGDVSVRVDAGAGRLRLSVDDSGPGIAEPERARIFERFHRATDAEGGAGLGLAIADAVVRASGGRWEVGVSPAGGARMEVSWPWPHPSSGGGGSRRARLPAAPWWRGRGA